MDLFNKALFNWRASQLRKQLATAMSQQKAGDSVARYRAAVYAAQLDLLNMESLTSVQPKFQAHQ